MGINLKDITQGKTYTWRLEFYEDEAMQTILDVSGHDFTLTAVDAIGTTVIELLDADFVQTSTSVRTAQISATDTALLTPGSYRYELEVILPDTTVEGWMRGNITVLPEFTV